MADFHPPPPPKDLHPSSASDSSSASDCEDDPPIPESVEDKLRYVFAYFSKKGLFQTSLIQFWSPVVDMDGRRLLTTCHLPFFLGDERFEEYRLCCVKYKYNIDVNKVDVEEDPTIICTGAQATAFLNHIPEMSPLESSAFQGGLMSVVLPVFYPSQSCCVGVVELTSGFHKLIYAFNLLNIGLEKVGLKTFHARERLPYKTICGLQNAKDEIDEALNIIWHAHGLPFAQVWIPYEDENQVAFSSSLQDTRTKRMLWLKLTGQFYDDHDDDDDDEDFGCLEDYSDACYRIPLRMDKDLAGKPHFIQNINTNDDHQHRLFHQRWLPSDFDCCFFTCLRSTKTGDLDYAFEFLWSDEGRNNVILLESLLLTLERHLPSFKFASGTKLGDEIDILDVENSTTSQNKYIKISNRNKISLKRGRQSKVEDCLAPLKARGFKLSREQIESHFGQTQEEAALELGVSASTLRRECNRLVIKWRGKYRSKGNVKHSYKNQSNTSEEEDQGGAFQDPSSAIIPHTSLDENILTIKAEYAGDVIKFTLPISSATYEAIQKEIAKKFKLDPAAARYKLKYLDDDDNEWILFDCDEDVALCTKNKRNVRLLLLQLGPSDK